MPALPAPRVPSSGQEPVRAHPQALAAFWGLGLLWHLGTSPGMELEGWAL